MSRKSVLISRALAGVLCAGALLAGSAQASVEPVVYTLQDQGFGQSSATGTITTDGKIGVLSLSDITAYDVTLAVGAQTFEVTKANGNLTTIAGSALVATQTALFFDTAGSGLFAFALYGADGVSGYCLSTGSGCDGKIEGEEEIVVNSSYDSSRAITGSVEIATVATSAVPEPSTWALMLLGFAGVGFAGFRKKASADARVA